MVTHAEVSEIHALNVTFNLCIAMSYNLAIDFTG